MDSMDDDYIFIVITLYYFLFIIILYYGLFILWIYYYYDSLTRGL